MMIFLQMITGVLFGIGLLFILLDVFRVPYLKSSSSVASLAKKQKYKVSVIQLLLESLEIWLAGHMHMNEYKKERLKADLFSAQMDVTPERYQANAMIQAMLVGILAIPAAFIHPIFSAIILGLATFSYYHKMGAVALRLRQKREEIEYELSAFVFTIEKTLRHNRDVLYMIETHADSAGEQFRQELQITAADMKSGNYESAILRLDARIGSSLMSDVCRGLISILKGDETQAYWTAMEAKLCTYQRELLKRRAQKIPRKTRYLSMALLICFIATFSLIIVYQIIIQLSGMFS